MAKTHQIDTAQLTLLMIICRIFSFLSFMPLNWNIYRETAALAGNIIGAVIAFILMIPALLLLSKGGNILSVSYSINPAIGRVSAIICWIACIYSAIDATAHFNFFMTVTSYPDANVLIFVAVFCLAVSYFVYVGIEAMSRSSWIFFISILIGLITLSIILSKEVNMVNFVSPVYNGYKPALKSAYYYLSRNVGGIILIMMAANTKGDILKSYTAYTIVTIAIVSLIIFLIIGVLGDYASTKPFPVFTLATVAQTREIKRLDSIHMYIWVFCALIKTSVFIYLSCVCCERVFGRRKKSIYIFVNTIIVGVVAFILISDINYFNKSYVFIQTGIVQNSTVYLLPLLLLLGMKYKLRKGENSQ